MDLIVTWPPPLAAHITFPERAVIDWPPFLYLSLPNFPETTPVEVGGYVEDSDGNIVRDSDGNPLEWTQ